MALYGSLATVRAQAPRSAGLAVAWAYVDELLREGSAVQQRVRAIGEGDRQKSDLGGGVFVIEECYQTKLRADGFFESHQKYVDVQTTGR
jgi:biofilm protein TabA